MYEMGILEIILLIAGIIIFIASFLLPVPGEPVSESNKGLAKDEIQALVFQEMEKVRGHVDDVVDEAIGYAVEKTERSLERLTNEKIMAVNEYSDTVLQEIHKNHEEVMFLYDMLNSKHANLKDTVSQVNKTVKEVEETKREAEAVVSSFQKLNPAEAVEGSTVQEKPSKAPDRVAKKPRQSTKQKASPSEGTQANSEISFLQEETAEGRNSNEKILKLYKEGRSTVAIAKALGLGVGEVKLVIDLYKNM